jgi:ABC-type molybdate transport system substrate-binding protein
VNRKIRTTIATAAAVLALSAGLFSAFARRTPAQTPDLQVMVSDGMKTVVEELTPQIEQSIGRKLVAQFNSSKNLRGKIQAGEPFDAVILTAARKFRAPGLEWAFAQAPRSPTSARRKRSGGQS